MGAWAPTSFGNDAALDLLLRLEEAGATASTAAEILKPFESYAAYEAQRITGNNKFVVSDAYIDGLLAEFDPAGLDDEFVARLKSRVGQISEDDGAYQAGEVVAAAEIILAVTTGDFQRIHEDGQFLSKRKLRFSGEDLASAKQSLATILKNKTLLKASGAKWQRNIKELITLLDHATSS